MKLILASASPRRKALLRKHGVRFQAQVSGVSENVRAASPRALVLKLALKKARSVAALWPDTVVLGADTVVALGRTILGKPKDEKDAHRILKRLSGSRHKVYTGVALVHGRTGRELTACEVSTIKMRRLSGDLIRRAARKHLDKAGAYAIQEKGDPFVEWVKGDYENVVGLPVRRVQKMLQSFS